MLPNQIDRCYCCCVTTVNALQISSPTAAGRPYPTLAHGTVPPFAPWFQLLLTVEGQITRVWRAWCAANAENWVCGQWLRSLTAKAPAD